MVLVKTKLSRLASSADALELLLEELHVLMVFLVRLLEKVFEVLLIRLSSQECWRDHVLEEDPDELAVLLLSNNGEGLVIFVEVRLDEVQLLVTIPESLDLLLRLVEGVL